MNFATLPSLSVSSNQHSTTSGGAETDLTRTTEDRGPKLLLTDLLVKKLGLSSCSLVGPRHQIRSHQLLAIACVASCVAWLDQRLLSALSGCLKQSGAKEEEASY